MVFGGARIVHCSLRIRAIARIYIYFDFCSLNLNLNPLEGVLHLKLFLSVPNDSHNSC
jgi:hypothetical protein